MMAKRGALSANQAVAPLRAHRMAEEVESDEDDSAFRAKEHLAQAWRLAQLGCWDSAHTQMAALQEQEVVTDDELAGDGSEDELSDEPSEVSTEGTVAGGSGAGSSSDADEEDETNGGHKVPSWRAIDDEALPPNVARAQLALFAAVGDALSGEVERRRTGATADVDGAVEQLQMFAEATACARSHRTILGSAAAGHPGLRSYGDLTEISAAVH